MQHHLPGFPVQTVEVVHELGRVRGLQHRRVGGSAEVGRRAGYDRLVGRWTKASLVLVFRLRDSLELHWGMLLYLGSLVPNSALTEKEAGHMLTHADTPHWLPFLLATATTLSNFHPQSHGFVLKHCSSCPDNKHGVMQVTARTPLGRDSCTGFRP